MRPARFVHIAARAAFAALFAFMSLLHGPIMAAAGTAPAGHHSQHAPAAVLHDHAVRHQHHHALPGAGDEQRQPAQPGKAMPSCYGIGCFLVLGSLSPPVPAEGNCPIARLTPAIAVALPSAAPDPLVPPPRAPV